MPLVIERQGALHIAVTHFFQQGGDIMCAPEVILFTGYIEWVPVELTLHPLSLHIQTAKYSSNGEHIIGVDGLNQSAIASFTDEWAKNIRAQNWLEDASMSSSL